jgi:hypothetical protein
MDSDGLADFLRPRAYATDRVSPSLLRVLERLDTPAQVVSDLGVTLAQNPLAEALLGVQTTYAGLERSIIYRWFTDPGERRRFPVADHASHSRSYAAHLRAAYSRRAGDGEAAGLVYALRRASREFATLWDRHDVAVRTDTRKRILHPVAGLLTLYCQILTSESETEQLVVFTAARGSEDARRLALLDSRPRIQRARAALRATR